MKKMNISVSLTIDVLIQEAQNNWEENFLIHEKSYGKSYLIEEDGEVGGVIFTTQVPKTYNKYIDASK